MKLLPTVLLLLVHINKISCIDCDLEPRNAETRLKKQLLCGDYDRTERPSNDTGPLTITVQMIILHYDFDDSDNKLFLNGFVVLNWMDAKLSWDPTQFENITDAVVTSSELWIPDMQDYTSAESDNMLSQCANPKSYVGPSGHIVSCPYCDFKTICKSDYLRWPFDTQTCLIVLRSYPDTIKDVAYYNVSTTFEMRSSNVNLKWRIVEATVSHQILYAISVLEFKYVLKRYSGVEGVLVIALALVLMTTNLILFWFRIDSTERMVLAGVNLFNHMHFLQNLLWMVPANGEVVPLVVTFYRDSLAITAIILFFILFTKNYQRYETRTPLWIETLTVSVASSTVGNFMCAIKEQDLKEVLALEQLSMENKLWRQFIKIIDRIVFFTIFITYFVMVILLIPRDNVTFDEDTLLYLLEE